MWSISGVFLPHGIGYFRLLRQALGHDSRSTIILLLIIVIIVAIYLHRRH
ncbi:MAG: hypothetical protein LKG79_05715 [Furfurilactobacillus sp.]|jgi:hypothetical protein|uniref:Uncharacterized protein n=1 Tax=Furfurilactobacillus milii TaxID=2888272 RepID=A0ABT6DB08_9LACO|nr:MULTISPECIES: hypothetical protein [Furfurilactobacillus]MCF6161365.1 hypothetical protein [Furfurilactobacillus milii]MCF6163745.1 hypothetical protein [Furfurilactobacillus milii]MCF6166798.1 hypothetical protein [Furfurilactobacillus rossiae]MCF6419577.1 hypothetical protein [Furfurilactobacillus milii]MCH4011708.1 hypothetical protein [Furfurilactobacillus sp.]